MRERPLRFGLVASTALSSPTGGACTVQGVEQEKEKHLHRLPAASIRVEKRIRNRNRTSSERPPAKRRLLSPIDGPHWAPIYWTRKSICCMRNSSNGDRESSLPCPGEGNGRP